MKKIMIASLKSILVFTLLCGVVYTVAVTLVGQVVFSAQANGSLVKKQEAGKTVVIGSKLIGQSFVGDGYLHGRPSEVSQLSPVSKEQKERVEKRVEKIAATDIPVDLVTASASGVDPEISVEGALFQSERIAAARNMKKEDVHAIIKQNIIGMKIGGITSQRVNVLGVNHMLDESE
ncbi:K+-transporting ATPase, C subunit [Enterococcus haemoperoxidus ATCC BAA-382]|uniref:Potassium-transporting ATPase KdpC subunit n=1 Tax=Enterococcus haemoperoxidus ATCC BAA-382 TaxID=1158608 RepID=R2SKD1_9ENTE|nr:potassium-transporting ATPase subunit C [Enterococcus haemoperoxidus]EOH93311.1 K+-transporting ATPase, C subunit [Enterococcus haemoperoxidus ATCC BAA-382]EOT61266.1 K+-transporting ATPase, C subunit [Enterococcus haemoperoxidus ATCC BAA-382]OJG54446.1 K+-transporting ATPase, C subunit [Enterococcus haemoperoxidus]